MQKDKAFIEIALPGQAPRRFRLKGSKLSVGRSEKCNIALPDGKNLQPEHLTVERHEVGLVISLANRRAEPLIFHGQSLQSCLVPWGDEVYAVGICFKPEKADKATADKAISPPLLIVAALLLPLSGYLILSGPAADADGTSQQRRPPALFDETAACSRPQAALHRAREAESAAAAKMQRYPFASPDGVEAVRLSAEARNCYGLANMKTDAARASRQVRAWKQRLTRDYQGHRLRLRLALQNENQGEALRQTRALKSLLSHRSDAYTSWLEETERRLSLNLQTDEPINR